MEKSSTEQRLKKTEKLTENEQMTPNSREQNLLEQLNKEPIIYIDSNRLRLKQMHTKNKEVSTAEKIDLLMSQMNKEQVAEEISTGKIC